MPFPWYVICMWFLLRKHVNSDVSRRHFEGSGNWDWKFTFSLEIVTVVPSGAASVPANI